MSADRLLELFNRLQDHFGPQHWWPAETPFEIMVGAVLTQNTNWQNVTKAIDGLKSLGLLEFHLLDSLPIEELARLIRPCGYYNLKARRLKNLLSLIRDNYHGDLELFFDQEVGDLRQELLAVKGIGPETADSITLYAAGKPTFVVDTYTLRILSRHDMIWEDEADYHSVQEMFMDSLPLDVALFNEYHALIVRTAKEYCKKKNRCCEDCPLNGF